jgi:hypothetical protein
LSGFAKAHHNEKKLVRKGVNGWNECEFKEDGKWVPTSDI